jgi:hypothetical protein
VGSPSEARTILVIVICLIFDICDLEFLVTPADCRKRGKTIEDISGGRSKPGPLGLDSLLPQKGVSGYLAGDLFSVQSISLDLS